MGDLWMQDEDVYSPIKTPATNPRRLDMEWDYISSPIHKPNSREGNLLNFNSFNQRWQSENADMTDFDDGYWPQTICRQMSQDMENQSTQPSSLGSRQGSVQLSSDGQEWSQNKFSAKCGAPIKFWDRQIYKEAAQELGREQASKSSFLSRLNDTVEHPERYSMMQDSNDDMSLEQSLEALSGGYKSCDTDLQNEIRIIDSHVSMSLDSPDFQTDSDWDRINITFQNSKNCGDYSKECLDLASNSNDGDSAKFYFQKLSKILWHKTGDCLRVKIKLNDEPVFPAKTTIEYLCWRYETSKAKIKAANERNSSYRQLSIDVYVPKI
jgi:hypothetical protein